jgi:hypothetical protein
MGDEKVNASTFGSASEFSKTKYAGQILHHRPPDDGCGGPHVSLYSRIFGNLMSDCEVKSHFENQFVECAHGFQNQMRLTFKTESERQSSALDLFKTQLGIDLQHQIDSILTDGVLVAAKSPAVIFEVKNEVYSTKTDAHMQAMYYYLRLWGRADCEHLRYNSYCPTLIITIAGPSLTIHGAVYVESKVLVDELCAPLSLLPDPDNRGATIRLVAALRAITIAVDALIDHHTSMHHTFDKSQLSFPCLRHFTGLTDSAFDIIYTHQLTRRVYRGQDSTGRQVIIKFSPIGCCLRAHTLLADHNLAPSVFAIDESLRPFWHVTLMAWVDAEPHCNLRQSSTSNQLRSALQLLHREGLVHGDLRAPNILLGRDGRLRLIDFEFAGVDGTAVYPALLNPNIAWPLGVRDGAVLKAEHDAFNFEALTGEKLVKPIIYEIAGDHDQGRNASKDDRAPKRLKQG